LLSPSRDELGIRAPCADQLLAARRRRKIHKQCETPTCQNRGRLQRSLTSTTTATSSTFATSLFPRRRTSARIRGLSGRADLTRPGPQIRSAKACVHQDLPKVSDERRREANPTQRAESRIAANSPSSLTHAAQRARRGCGKRRNRSRLQAATTARPTAAPGGHPGPAARSPGELGQGRSPGQAAIQPVTRPAWHHAASVQLCPDATSIAQHCDICAHRDLDGSNHRAADARRSGYGGSGLAVTVRDRTTRPQARSAPFRGTKHSFHETRSKVPFSQVGRLGLEPRTHGLKA
jgi:hypothetical protein